MTHFKDATELEFLDRNFLNRCFMIFTNNRFSGISGFAYKL